MRGEMEMVWTCAEEGRCREEDAEEGAASQEGKRKDEGGLWYEEP